MGRLGFIFRRLVMLVPLLAGIVLVVFLLLKVTPGDPAREAVGLRATNADVAGARKQMGLDKPVLDQYFTYLDRAVHGNLGYSYKTHTKVTTTIAQRAPVTLWLIAAGTIVAVLMSVPLAVLAAAHRDRLVDHLVRGFCVLAIAMPTFWVGIMLITLIALRTGWFPVGGFGGSFSQRLRSIVLPGLTLGIAMAPVMIRSLRATIITALESEYVVAARALGVSGVRLLRRFVLRNALPPTVTLLAVQAGYFLFGAVILETAFSLPGMGQGIVQAAVLRDFPLVQGYTLVLAVCVVAVYLIADIVTALLDPRVVIEA
jgi:peptide/nickel transport system permease protein